MHLRAWGMYVHRLDVHRRREGVTMWGATWGVVAKCCDAFFSLLLLSPLPPLLPPPPAAFPGTASHRERTLMLGQRARGPTVLLAMAALVRILVPGGLLPVRPGPGDPGGPTRRAFIVPSPRITGWKGGSERARDGEIEGACERINRGGREERAVELD